MYMYTLRCTRTMLRSVSVTYLISAPVFALQASLAVSDSDTAALQYLITEILTAWETTGRRRRRRMLFVLLTVTVMVRL